MSLPWLALDHIVCSCQDQVQLVYYQVESLSLMQLSQIITPDRVCIDTSSQSKTAVLLKISQLLSQNEPQLDTEVLFDAYWRRESLGSTGIGHGIIIPHTRTPVIQHTRGCFLKLDHPVDFAAEDKQPIDLVVGLVVPQEQTEQHLQLLKNISRRFSQPAYRRACRNITDSLALYTLLSKNLLSEKQVETENSGV